MAVDGCGRGLHADRLRERRQPDARASCRTATRVRDSCSRRCRHAAPRTTGTRREPAAVARGRQHRTAGRLCTPADVRRDGARRAAGRCRRVDRRPRVCRGGVARSRLRDRDRFLAGGLRVSLRWPARIAIDTLGCAWRTTARALRARRDAGGADASAARGLSAVAAQPMERRQRAAGIRRTASCHDDRVAQQRDEISDPGAPGNVLRTAARRRARRRGYGLGCPERCAGTATTATGRFDGYRRRRPTGRFASAASANWHSRSDAAILRDLRHTTRRRADAPRDRSDG